MTKPDFLSRLHDDIPFEEGREADLRRALVEDLEYRRKVLIVRMTLWLLACVGSMFGGVWLLSATDDVRTMLLGFFLMMLGLVSSVLIKLWFWVVDNRIATIREIKQVQLQLGTLAARMEKSAQGDKS